MPFSPDANSTNNLSLEAMRRKIAERLDKAKNNPMPFERYQELDARFSALEDKFFNTGVREPDDIREQDLIEKEAEASTAIADDLIEFKEMLRQYRILLPNPKTTSAWAQDTLAHENAHANVSQQLGFKWIGYGLLFMRKPNGKLSVQPNFFHEPDFSWSPRETITNQIATTDAVRVYGGSELSAGDVRDIRENQERLKRLANIKAINATKKHPEV